MLNGARDWVQNHNGIACWNRLRDVPLRGHVIVLKFYVVFSFGQLTVAGNTVRASTEVQRLKMNRAREICSIKEAMGTLLWSTSMVPLLNGTHAACLGRRDVKDEERVSDKTCRTPTILARSGGPNDLLRIFTVAQVRFC